MEITLSIKKSVEENAEVYFEKGKKAKKKLAGAKEALVESRKKLEKLKKQEEQFWKEHEAKQEEKTRKKHWFEKFRWFYSSEGFLCVGGRDATTNEIVIKKHADKDDIVFHTNMAGSPFFVIKSEKKKIGQATLDEAAISTASFSRAWKLGLSTLDVFYVNPEQVTKKAQSGEYMTKGAFMIYGKTNELQARVELAIGKKDDMIMCAAEESVKKHSKKYFVIQSGREKPSSIAKKVKAEFGGDLDDIIRVLPSGGIKVIRAKST